MPPLPVMLNLRHRRCLIIGGGSVALRRAQALLEAEARVEVVSPEIAHELAAMDIQIHLRAYHPDDLEGAFLLVTATDDPQVNAQAAAEAGRRHVLVNRADAGGEGDVTIPAHLRRGPVTISVDTGGISPHAAAALREQLADALDPDWPRLLAIVGDYRHQIQQQFDDPDERHRRLRKLSDEKAMHLLKTGDEEALRAYCAQIMMP